MKTLKSYRLSSFTLKDLEALNDYFHESTETEIIERAVHEFKAHTFNDLIISEQSRIYLDEIKKKFSVDISESTIIEVALNYFLHKDEKKEG